MSIELLKKEHLLNFNNFIESIKKRLRIASPFIGFETSKHLVNSIKGSQAECTIITSFNREDFLNHVNSLEGLKILTEAGFEVYALKDLHTRLYIFDSESAILGSANFAVGGVRFNNELSLMIEDETELIFQLSNYYDELLGKIKASGDWLLDLNRIEDEIRIVDNLTKNRKDKNTKYKNTAQFGAVLTEQDEAQETDMIEQVIRENIDSGFKNGIWLKFIETGDDSYKRDEKYSFVELKSSNKKIAVFPCSPREITDRDFIYLSIIVWNKKDTEATPIIVARARTKGFESDNVALEEDFLQYDWLREYPYYIELYDIEMLDTEIGNCISLDRLIRELGCDLYPATQGQQLSIAELKSRHFQKSHLMLTPSAKQYIDKLFDDLGKEYGISKV